jgi:hypothetical protein
MNEYRWNNSVTDTPIGRIPVGEMERLQDETARAMTRAVSWTVAGTPPVKEEDYCNPAPCRNKCPNCDPNCSNHKLKHMYDE